MKNILALSAVLFSTTSLAADYNLEVCAIQSYSSSDTALIKACEAWESKNGCSNGWIAWHASEHNGKAMYSTALSALTLGAKVTVRLNGSSCISGYDATNMIRLTK